MTTGAAEIILSQPRDGGLAGGQHDATQPLHRIRHRRHDSVGSRLDRVEDLLVRRADARPRNWLYSLTGRVSREQAAPRSRGDQSLIADLRLGVIGARNAASSTKPLEPAIKLATMSGTWRFGSQRASVPLGLVGVHGCAHNR